jgi:hypothetical protein
VSGIQTAHPTFANLQARIASYLHPSWTQASVRQSAEDLASAGFFYTGQFKGFNVFLSKLF